MANNKEEKIERLSLFEETLMYSSYRYMIGRHTIASNMHAGDLVVNFIPRMSQEQRGSTARDVNESIRDALRALGWHMSYSVQSTVCPMTMFLDYISQEGLLDKLAYIRSIYVDYDYDTKQLTHDIRCSDEVNKMFLHCDISDLLPWMDFANALNSFTHTTIKVKDPDDPNAETKEIKVFPSYVEDWDKQGRTVKKVWKNVDKYLSSPQQAFYVNESWIVKD